MNTKMRDERFHKARTEFEAASICGECMTSDRAGEPSSEMTSFLENLRKDTKTVYLVCTDLPNDFSAYMYITKHIPDPTKWLEKWHTYAMPANVMRLLAVCMWDLYSIKPTTLFKQITNVEVLQRIGDPKAAATMTEGK